MKERAGAVNHFCLHKEELLGADVFWSWILYFGLTLVVLETAFYLGETPSVGA